MLIHLVADYGKDDLAFAEVAQALLRYIPEANIIATPVPAFDTLSTGFVVAQLALQESPRRIVYHNTAPRKDDLGERENNAGEPLAACKIGNTLVVGPNSGYSFSFLKEKIYLVDTENDGSQFRSRDIFPGAIAALLEDKGWVDQTVNPPPVPEDSLLYVDGYGNMKTSIKKNWLDVENLLVTINGEEHLVQSRGSAFADKEGSLVLTEGSSGRSPFLELFLRGGSAHALFGYPGSGSTILLREK